MGHMKCGMDRLKKYVMAYAMLKEFREVLLKKIHERRISWRMS